MAQADFEKNWIINSSPTSGSGVATNQGLGINGGTMTHSAAWNGTGWTYHSTPVECLTGTVNLSALRPFTIFKIGAEIRCILAAIEVPDILDPVIQTLPAESWTAREV